jgi:imidazolonepropionase-like amidohydrolase
VTGTLFSSVAVADGRSPSLRRDMSLLVQDGVIRYLGPRDAQPDPGTADIVPCAGAVVIPAMVDCHAHFAGSAGPGWFRRMDVHLDERIRRGREAARDLVQSGVLFARDVGAPERTNLQIRDALREEIAAPVIVAAGNWIAIRDKFFPFGRLLDRDSDLASAVEDELDAGADLVKIVGDAGPNSAEVTFSVSELRRAVDVVHARGRKVAVHAQGAGARVATEAGVDSIEHGHGIDAETAGSMRRQGTTLVTTMQFFATGLQYADIYGGWPAENRATLAAELEKALAAVGCANGAGVRIATGSDFGSLPRPGRLALEVELLVRAGLQPHEALASATWIGGELLGIAHAGRLEEGGPATFLLVHGDPLSDPAALARVWRVYRNGQRLA